MTDNLLGHYNRELLHIRRAAAAFAADHPGIAGRLRASADAVEDPHVERLIEAFAFLTARVRQTLDDDFPALVDALADVLYPHYRRPIPSMATVQFLPAPGLAGPGRVPAGAILDTEPVEGEPCRFRTAYPVDLHPIEIRGASLAGRPFAAPRARAAEGAATCLRLSLAAARPGVPFRAAAPRVLRLFLRGGPSLAHPLHELLLNDALALAVAAGPDDPAPALLDPSALRPVGFGLDEGLLAYPAEAHLGFRLLTEFFAFPEKFLYVDLVLPEPGRLHPEAGAVDVFVFLKRSVPGIERAVTRDAFALGCAPAVNLFPQAAEPIRADGRTADYRVVPDSRRGAALEVYSVERVLAGAARGRPRVVPPVYGLDHADGGAGTRWLASRRPASGGLAGTDAFLSLTGLDPDRPADAVLSVDTLCTDRDRPERLPFGGGRPALSLAQPSPSIAAARLLAPPTPARRRPSGEGWRLISHLALNHLSLAGAGDAAGLRELLALYDVGGTAEARALIDGVAAVSARLGTARVRGRGEVAFCRGIDVALTLDEGRLSGGGTFLMASVLERFFALYASVNSFSRLTVRVKGRPGVLKAWPARAGDRPLL